MRRRAPKRIWFVVCLVVLVVAGAVTVTLTTRTPDGPRTQRAPLTSSSPSVTPSPSAVVPFRRAVGRPTRVLFSGDSLTAGFFASTPSATFASLVTGWIGPVTVTTAQRAQQNLSTVSGITDVPADLDLAVIELGTNDVNRTDPPAFDAQYRDLLLRVRESSPRSAVICLGVWAAVPGIYDAAIQRQCVAAGGLFVPLSKLFVTPANHGPAGITTTYGTSDTFHPNDRGHYAIAQAIIAGLGSG